MTINGKPRLSSRDRALSWYPVVFYYLGIVGVVVQAVAFYATGVKEPLFIAAFGGMAASGLAGKTLNDFLRSGEEERRKVERRDDER